MTSRRSYSGLMSLPAYGLYDKNAKIVASIRAQDAGTAHSIFKAHNLRGLYVKRIP